MNEDKDITTKNSKGLWHGYQEWYDDSLMVRGNFKVKNWNGYVEIHNTKSNKSTVFFLT